jgi:hypothetical protein
LKVLARDFDDFLKAIAARESGLPDFDEGEPTFHVPGVEGEPKREGLGALQQEFEEWFKKHTSLLEPYQSPETEALRQRVYQRARTQKGVMPKVREWYRSLD